MSPGITNPSRSRACAAMNTGSASLTFCCFEVGDLRAQLLLGGLQLLHLGALREVGAHRTRDGQGQHADDRGENRRAPRRRSEPLLGLLFCRRDDDSAEWSSFGFSARPRLGSRLAARSSVAARAGGRAGAVPRLAGPSRGPPLRDRAVSPRARVIWPPPRSAGRRGRRRSGRRRRGSPRCAAAGCTWRPARCARAHRS